MISILLTQKIIMGDIGVKTGVEVKSNDKMSKEIGRMSYDVTLRNGSVVNKSHKDVGFPVGAAAKEGVSFANTLPKVPAGKVFWNTVYKVMRRCDLWMRKDKKGYLELDAKKVTTPLNTTKTGFPFSPKVEHVEKSKLAKFKELLENFDDPRF